MDRKNHPTKSLLVTWCLVSLCALFCLLAGCEEGMVDSPELAAAPDLTETAGADLEAVENTLAETSEPEPKDVAGRKAVVANAEESATPDPAQETLTEADTLEPEDVAVQEEVAVIAEEIATPDPAQETLAEADTLEPEDVAGQEEVVAIAEESATPDPVVAILADTIDTEPETLTEEQALADLEKKIGLKDPIPTKIAELTPDPADSAAVLDKVHIADALLLAANGKTIEGQEEIQESAKDSKPKGFVDKVSVTPGSTVLKFARRHFIILLAAVLCVASLMVVRKKKLLSGDPRHRTNSHE